MSNDCIIVTSDLHFTSHPRDEYRFKFIEDTLPKIAKHHGKYPALCILGDLTDAKDKHNAKLVNRIVSLLTSLRITFTKIYILKGNHDYIDPDTPFFRFLDVIDGIHFIVEPEIVDFDLSGSILRAQFIPHGCYKGRGSIDDSVDVVFLHETFKGSRTSGDFQLDGHKPVHDAERLYVSGDIHYGQQVGDVLYIGAPYHVAFGDAYEPRVMVITDEEYLLVDVSRHTPRKLYLRLDADTKIENLDLREGDQCKVRYYLREEEVGLWPSIRDEIMQKLDELGVSCYAIEVLYDAAVEVQDEGDSTSVEPLTVETTFDTYCREESVPEAFRKVGLRLIREGLREDT